MEKVIIGFIGCGGFSTGAPTHIQSKFCNGNHFWEPSPDHRSQFLTGDAYAVRHFAESIINNTQPISNIRDGYEAMKLVRVLHEKAEEVVCLDAIT